MPELPEARRQELWHHTCMWLIWPQVCKTTAAADAGTIRTNGLLRCRMAQKARIRALAALAATWGIEDTVPVASAAPAAPAQAVLPNSEAAKARTAVVREDLRRRRADTQQQLRKYVQSNKISAEIAQQRMAEVDQVRQLPLRPHADAGCWGTSLQPLPAAWPSVDAAPGGPAKGASVSAQQSGPLCRSFATWLRLLTWRLSHGLLPSLEVAPGASSARPAAPWRGSAARVDHACW